MLKFIAQRLQVKILLVVILALLIPTAFIGIYSISITTEQVIKTAQEKDSRFVKSEAAAALEFLAEGERDVLFLSQSPAMRRFVGTLDSSGNGIISSDSANTKEILSSQLKLFLSSSPTYTSVRVLDTTGHEVLGVDDIDGVLTDVADADLVSQAVQDYFIEAIRLAGPVYISDVELSTTHKKVDVPYNPIIRFSLPLYAEEGGIAGVIALTARALPLVQSRAPLSAIANATSYIIDDQGNYLSHPDSSNIFGDLLKTNANFNNDQPHDALLIGSQTEGVIFSSTDRPDALQAFMSVAIPNRDNRHWTFVYEEQLSQLLGDINNARLVILVLAVVALLIALTIAWFITRNIVHPVQQLATVSGAISRGEWDVAIPVVKSGDEIGRLALAFDRMSKELRALYVNLEMRVMARTSELEAVAKVSAAAAAILDLDQLLMTVSELTKANFNLYHVNVYLLDVSDDHLALAAGSGTIGQALLAQDHRIALNAEKSVVAEAGRTGRGVIVNDTHAETNFLPNPLLPETRSELDVPLTVAGKLLGVLDLQADQVHRFSGSDLQVMTILGDQIAVAVQNASLYKNQLETTRQLRIAQQKAEQANKAKSLFLSNMSHELRTPLNVVIGYTSSMLERPAMYENIPLPAIYAKDIRLIQDNGYHLMGLINDILDLSKIEAGKLELQMRPTNLSNIFRGVLATSVGLVKAKPVQIKADFPDQLPLVQADATRVRQIILNLMANAVKFTDHGSILLQAHVADRIVRISVTDTGIGIPNNALAHIFDRFEQASQDIGKQYGGTGLGLDISKQLCQMHSGDLTVESVFGQGSTFSFTLPIVDEALRDLPAPDIVSTTSQVFMSGIDVSQAQTVMLALDAQDGIRLQQALKNAGYVVVMAYDMDDTFDMALGLLPDVIVLDMQHMGDRHMLTLLHANAETASIPVIVCVEHEMNLPNSALQLHKPVDVVQLAAAIQSVRANHALPTSR